MVRIAGYATLNMLAELHNEIKMYHLISYRTDSFTVLANCLKKRHGFWKQGKTDRNLHPIPFLADGPNSCD
jgi:hypothetical protein